MLFKKETINVIVQTNEMVLYLTSYKYNKRGLKKARQYFCDTLSKINPELSSEEIYTFMKGRFYQDDIFTLYIANNINEKKGSNTLDNVIDVINRIKNQENGFTNAFSQK